MFIPHSKFHNVFDGLIATVYSREDDKHKRLIVRNLSIAAVMFQFNLVESF